MEGIEVKQSTILVDIWAIEIDILEVFKTLCKKYGLTYYAGGGTMLGAIRHKGFIPWDDDIDLYMMWKDYKILLDVAPKELTYPYFFQSYLTEPQGEVSHSRIRRSDTTGYTKWEFENVSDPCYNKGIFIDIFPMFNVPADLHERDKQREMIMKYWRAIRGYNAFLVEKTTNFGHSAYSEYISEYKKLSKELTITEIKEKYIESCAYIENDTAEVGLTSWKTFHPNLIWAKQWFDTWKEIPFEYTTINCPEMSEKILDVTYGDWRIPKKGAVHEMFIVDVNKPFIEYVDSKMR